MGLLESQVGSRWSLCSRGSGGDTMITLGRVWAQRVNNEELCVGEAKTLRRRSECVQVCLGVCAHMCSAKALLGLATQHHYHATQIPSAGSMSDKRCQQPLRGQRMPGPSRSQLLPSAVPSPNLTGSPSWALVPILSSCWVL